MVTTENISDILSSSPSNDEGQPVNSPQVNPVAATPTTTTTSRVYRAVRPAATACPTASAPARAPARAPTRAPARALDRSKRQGGGISVGAGTYYLIEKMNFLGIMEKVLPIGPEQWAEVASQHSVLFSGQDVDSIRRKYHTLQSMGIPTGDLLCPADVKLSKKIKYDIGVKADLGGVMRTSTTSK